MRHTPKPLDYVLAALVIAIVLLSTACRQAPTPEPVLEPDTDVPAGPAPQGFPEIAQRLGNGEERIRALAFAPDGETLAVGIYPEARLWSTADGHQLKMIEHRHAVQDITFSPDGSLLAAGQDVYGVQLTRLADDEVLPQLHGGYDSVVAFSPDGTALASGNRQGVVWVWGISDGTVPDNAEPIAVLEAEDAGNLTALAYSSGGSLIAAGHRDGTVHLWDTTSGNVRHSLAPESHYSSAHALTFSPNGEWLAVAGTRGDAGHVVRLWDANGGTVLRDLPLPSEALDLDLSRDGRILAVATRDGAILWDMDTYTPLATLQHSFDDQVTDWITSVALSPDGNTLAVGRWNGVVELWRATL